jgi:hypothetical protein
MNINEGKIPTQTFIILNESVKERWKDNIKWILKIYECGLDSSGTG